MQLIVAPIRLHDIGLQVANLQAAILFLLDRGVIKALNPPNVPTADDLKALAEGLRAEQASQLFGDATRQLGEGKGDRQLCFANPYGPE